MYIQHLKPLMTSSLRRNLLIEGYIFKSTHTCIRVYLYVCIYTYVYTCTWMYMYMYIYICIHMYIYDIHTTPEAYRDQQPATSLYLLIHTLG